MSDLYCPATFVLARHAEAEYESTLAVRHAGGSLTGPGREQAHELGERLATRRVAMVYVSDLARAVQTGEIAAGVLGVPVRVRRGLREFDIGDLEGSPFEASLFDPVVQRWRAGDLDVGCPGAETGRDVVRRVSAELHRIADEHRGETVLVVSHGGAIQLTAPALAPAIGDCWADDRQLRPAAAAEMEADADGWRCLSWGGVPV